MRKSDGVRVDNEKDRWGESSALEKAMGWAFTIKRSNGVKVHHEKKSDRVRVHHKKKPLGESSP